MSVVPIFPFMTPRRRTTADLNSPRTLNTKSTGEILRSAREAREETLQDVSRAIKVRVSMLQAIEEGKFFGLTDPLYLKGFIRAYALHVGLKEAEVMPFFRREYDAQEHQQQLGKPLAPIEAKKQKITPAKMVIGVLAVAIIAVVGYSYSQYVSVSLDPTLEILSPGDSTTAESGQVEVRGETDPDVQLSLNGEPVALTPNGEFRLTVALAAGPNTLEFKAVNKLGRITSEERTVVGPARLAQTNKQARQSSPVPTVLSASNSGQLKQSSASASESATLKQVDIEVVVGPSAVWLEVHADGAKRFAGMVLPGASHPFTAGKILKVKTGNAGSTRIILNGADQGLLGGNNEVVEKEYR
jgi:cytoskeleton protein RodZ